VRSSIISNMDYPQIQQDTITKCEPIIANKNINLASVVSCLDGDLNYTYAKSCRRYFYFNYLKSNKNI